MTKGIGDVTVLSLQQELPPMRRASNLYLPYTAWPEDDRTRWEAAFKIGANPFDDCGPAAHLAEATRLTLLSAYARFLAFLSAEHSSLLARAPAARLDRKIIEATSGGNRHLAEA